MQGFDMRINEKGDAEGNYTLLSLQKVDPVNETNSTDYYPLDKALSISADFISDEKDPSRSQLRFLKNISWPKNIIPKDEPECGFDGYKCRDDSGTGSS